MAITNLTNTTWRFNDYITFDDLVSSKPSYDGEETTVWNLKFNSGSRGNTYTSIRLSTANGFIWNMFLYDKTLVYMGGAWYVDEYGIDGYRIITITGGTDVTNPDLIAWLEANGTLVVNKVLELNPFLTNIANAIRMKKGTTYKINAQDFASEIESISGGVNEDDIYNELLNGSYGGN